VPACNAYTHLQNKYGSSQVSCAAVSTFTNSSLPPQVTPCHCRSPYIHPMSLWLPCGLLGFAKPITVTATVYQ
jgi:hypothetical protein